MLAQVVKDRERINYFNWTIMINHNLANIHPKAKIGKNVIIEPFATIYEDVVIGIIAG